MRSEEERGSIAYSAVTQPLPLPRKNGGTRSSMVAVHSTFVRPISTSAEPSAWRAAPRAILSGRIAAAPRPSVRVIASPLHANPSLVLPVHDFDRWKLLSEEAFAGGAKRG